METKEFYASDGRLVAEASFIEPDIMLVRAVSGADETAAAELAGYVLHLFETGDLKAILVDASKGGGFSPEAIRVFAKSDSFGFVGRAAIFGITNPLFRTGIQAIIRASGRDNVKLFNNMEEALAFAKDG